jgi:hypothetical protein
MTVDDEAMRYLALAAEIRVRTLLTSAIRAQQHRATATHTAKPAMTKAHGDRPAQALWSQKITSDPHAVMIALTNANREENKAHRVARTERNARETEIARAVAAQRERDGVAADTGSSTAAAAEAGSSAADPANQGSPSVPLPKKPTKGKKNREISADVQAKLTNAVASKGRKKYAWETSGGSFRPPVPSLLSGNRKKKEEEKKKKEEEEAAAAAAAAAKAIEPPKPKRPKRTVSAPHRRRVDIDDVGDKKGHDDKTLTVVDMAFALEHDGGERGAGTTEDIVRRLWTRPGGPYGT